LVEHQSSEPRKDDVAPSRAHTLERLRHAAVVYIKSAVFQEHSCAIAFGFQPPSQCPGGGECVDEQVRRVDLEHRARLLAVARHVESELVAHHRGHLALGPPQLQQRGFGQESPHRSRWLRHELIHPDRREP
jgi:hypothetical protein